MKRSIFGFAAAGIILSGCMKNDVTVSDKDSSNIIKFETTATRTKAAVTQGSTLQDDGDGFKVYGTSGSSPSGWYKTVNGTNDHFFDGTKWGWKGTQEEWPKSGEYPMTFYAWFPVAPTGLTVASQTVSNLSFNFAVPALSSAQKDLVAGTVSTAAMPEDGTLPITFNHILSKVNFDVSITSGYQAYIQALGVAGVDGTATYDVKGDSWSANTDFDALFNYFGDFASSGSVKTVATFPGAGFVGSESMMLIPQDPSDNDWVPSSGAATGKTYVQVLYRLTQGLVNKVGYASASGPNGHPGISGSITHATYTGPLFVLVGYPYESKWDKGNGYTYTLALPGGTGGYIVSKYYYDDKGNETLLEIGKNPGEPVYDVDLTIRLIPEVGTWNEKTADIYDLEMPEAPKTWQNITDEVLKNTQEPFSKGAAVTNLGSGRTLYEMKDWTVNSALAVHGNVINNGKDVFDVMAFRTVIGVSNPETITNGKMFQTVTLEAGTYRFDVHTHYWDPGDFLEAYATAAFGNDLPDTNNLSGNSLGFVRFNLGNETMGYYGIPVIPVEFHVSAKGEVSVGFVVNISNAMLYIWKVELWAYR